MIDSLPMNLNFVFHYRHIIHVAKASILNAMSFDKIVNS